MTYFISFWFVTLCLCIPVVMIFVTWSSWYTHVKNTLTHTTSPFCVTKLTVDSGEQAGKMCPHIHLSFTHECKHVNKHTRVSQRTQEDTHKVYLIWFMSTHKRQRAGSRRNKYDKQRHNTTLTQTSAHSYANTSPTTDWESYWLVWRKKVVIKSRLL